MAQCATVSFDVSTFEIWGALLNGARVVVVGKETAKSPRLSRGDGREANQHGIFDPVILNQMAEPGGPV